MPTGLIAEDAVNWWVVCAHQAKWRVSVHEGGLEGPSLLESGIHECLWKVLQMMKQLNFYSTTQSADTYFLS